MQEILFLRPASNMKFDQFIKDLGLQLREPLPGKAAQNRMTPVTRKKYPADPDLSKARTSSVLALFYPEEESVQLVFIKRPVYNGVHSGQIAFPGGGLEKHDKDTLDTALRETREEIGIPEEDIRVIGKLSDLYIPPSNFLVHPYVGYLNSSPDFQPDPQEVSEIFSLDIHKLMDDKCLQHREVSGKSYSFTVPCFYMDDRLIWGATSMMLSELLEVIRSFR